MPSITPLGESKKANDSTPNIKNTRATLPGPKIVSTAFQRTSPHRDSASGRTRMRRAIEEQQRRLFHEEPKNDENKKPDDPAEKDLRSIYLRYLSGGIEKQSVIRSGEQWTSGYRARRRQRRRTKVERKLETKERLDSLETNQPKQQQQQKTPPPLDDFEIS